MRRDQWGVPTSCPADALTLWDDAQARALRLDDGAPDLLAELRATAPGYAAGHALAALLADDEGDAELAASAAADAVAHLDGATDRERSFAHAVQRHVQDGIWASEATWWAHYDEFPEDVYALGQVLIYPFFGARRDGEEQFATLSRRTRAALGDVTPVRDLLGWVAQDEGRIDEAHGLADSVIADDPRHVSAAHTKAHTFYEASDHAAGVAWLDGWCASFDDDGPAYNRHLSWHAGLHEIALGHEQAALVRLARDMQGEQLRPSDGALTLTLLQSLGVVPWGEDPTGSLAMMVDVAAEEPPLMFNGYTRSLGLAAQGEVDALRTFALTCATSTVPGVADWVPDLATGLACWVEGDAVTAARHLDRVAPHFVAFGGSLAQRDVLHDVYVAVLVDAGRADDAVAHVAGRDASRGLGVDRRLLQCRNRRSVLA